MSMSTHVVGFKPADDKWRQMKAIWDACMKAKVNTPEEVDQYFGDNEPDESGVVVEQKALGAACKKWEAEMQSGFEVDITKLPPDVKIIRFVNSW